MSDPSENPRRILGILINSQVKSLKIDPERKRLEAQYGQVWDTKEVQEGFEVLTFLAPLVVVREKATGKKGFLAFQDRPRFYFDFTPDKD